MSILYTDVNTFTMSFGVKIDTVPQRVLQKCVVRPSADSFNPEPEAIKLYSMNHEKGIVRLPYCLWPKLLDVNPFSTREVPRIHISYIGRPLYTKETDPKGKRDQQVVYDETKAHLMSGESVLVAAHTGFGKTTLGVKLICELSKRTLVLCHNKPTRSQWYDNLIQGVKGKVGRWSSSEGDKGDDVVLMGSLMSEKVPSKLLRRFGTVVIDEVHMCTRSIVETLLKMRPKYLIAFSATPDRKDAFNAAFPLFFSHTIIRREVKNMRVIKVETDFEPEVRYVSFRGKNKPDWCHVINSLAYDKDRQKFIVDTIERLTKDEGKTLILSARKLEKKAIKVLLRDRGYNVGGIKTRKGKQYVVTGFKKGGVGFDDPDLKAAVFVDDQGDVRQYEGRVRDDNSLIIDFVDKHPTLEGSRHWGARKSWYTERGATIKVVPRKTMLKSQKTTRKKTVLERMNEMPRLARFV